ncbi:pyridoxal phosphate-dependent aminotransferase [Aspergillus saccharolyticus JOP 1030-1]|uniref:PLP-dependent transferase n=1 Tax=Aspergillus saccharolyticus JOP 1030-1 TaxID=1450539 RepID=A0A318Z297_9EURO|nr:PLP-dependent transferase [Aspergillus saccharolyticus JOP 1030-1]PYH40407.1 PLP-dependent transferase [Aspergillus saccharolyticus JOP 1030-1]
MQRTPDVSIGYRLEVGTTVTFICACIVVSLRGVARSIYAKLSWDDYLMLFAVVQALIATVFDYLAVNHGLGRHLIYLQKTAAVQAMYYDLLSQVFCINALSCAKISICLSYLRILKGTRHSVLRVTCYLTAFLVFAVNTVVIISFRTNKLLLCGLMGLGVITGVFATIRTIESGLGLKNGTSDASYTTVMGLMWAGMERNIAMMIASVPALRPLTTPLARWTSQTISYLGVGSSSKTQQTYELGGSGASQRKSVSNVLLSTRGGLNLTQVLARIPPQLLNPIERRDEIDLSMAENRVIRAEVLQLARSAIETSLRSQGFFGDAGLLELLAGVFQNHFRPYASVHPDHIAVTAGAAAGLDALLYNICNPGDGVLVPCPYWNGYDALFTLHSEVRPVGVVLPSFEESFGPGFLAALDDSYRHAPGPIKALVLANPHNPLGRPYSQSILEQCMSFCQARNLHLISDEVFGLSHFPSPDFQAPPPFTSCLSIDPNTVGCDPARVHVVWSMSKDLAASGVRLGCVVTRNRPLRNVVGLVASVHVSGLSTVFAKEVLASSQLPDLLARSATRLADAYTTLTTAFRAAGIEYFPCHATVFVLARLAPQATSWDEEMLALHAYRQAGVVVVPGRAYHLSDGQAGWMRVTFAMEAEALAEGIRRIERVYRTLMA